MISRTILWNEQVQTWQHPKVLDEPSSDAEVTVPCMRLCILPLPKMQNSSIVERIAPITWCLRLIKKRTVCVDKPVLETFEHTIRTAFRRKNVSILVLVRLYVIKIDMTETVSIYHIYERLIHEYQSDGRLCHHKTGSIMCQDMFTTMTNYTCCLTVC